MLTPLDFTKNRYNIRHKIMKTVTIHTMKIYRAKAFTIYHETISLVLIMCIIPKEISLNYYCSLLGYIPNYYQRNSGKKHLDEHS